MIIKRRIVGQHPDRVFIYFKPVFHRLNRHSPFLIRKQPVKRCKRNFSAERIIPKIHFFDFNDSLLNICTQPEYIRNKLKRRYIFFFFVFGTIHCVIGEIQPCHTKPLFVGCIVIKRISASDSRHSDNRIMLVKSVAVTQKKRIFSRHYANGFVISAVKVKISAEIKAV